MRGADFHSSAGAASYAAWASNWVFQLDKMGGRGLCFV
ncbi:hypothetical protein B4099_1071 [Heyndrickxia coagulans]|uniref:Uncharacterized protein n=1 Tax=Heyndrickxia coagulans TaxID=1398 RepID=A0A150KF46_HEYCO|nr:hypothetical protein B4099_1071 [Heyndrickxia coagulans]